MGLCSSKPETVVSVSGPGLRSRTFWCRRRTALRHRPAALPLTRPHPCLPPVQAAIAPAAVTAVKRAASPTSDAGSQDVKSSKPADSIISEPVRLRIHALPACCTLHSSRRRCWPWCLSHLPAPLLTFLVLFAGHAVRLQGL